MYTIGNAFGNKARAAPATPNNPVNKNDRDERLAAAQASLKKKHVLATAESKKHTLDSAMKVDSPASSDKEGSTESDGNQPSEKSDDEMDIPDRPTHRKGTAPAGEEEYVVDDELIDDFLKGNAKNKESDEGTKGDESRSPPPDHTTTPPPPNGDETREPRREPSPPRDPIITNPHLFLEPPSEGWPEVPMTRQYLYRGTHVESFPHLENIPQPKFVAYVWGTRPKKEGSQDIKTIKDFIKKFMPEAKPKIFHPLPFKNDQERFYPAAPHIISNLTDSQAMIFLDVKVLATKDTAVFFKEYMPTPSNFAFVIEYYGATTDEEDCEEVKTMVQRCFRAQTTKVFPIFLCEQGHNDNLVGFREAAARNRDEAIEIALNSILNSVQVVGSTFVSVRGKERKERPIFLVNISPPTLTPQGHEWWIEGLMKVTYNGDYGKASVKETYNCAMCKAINHIEANCPFLEIPNFPAPTEDAKGLRPRPERPETPEPTEPTTATTGNPFNALDEAGEEFTKVVAKLRNKGKGKGKEREGKGDRKPRRK
ncbi:hypothetical protein CVT24_009764 [Panaeolus cyanescens]|uniref:Uncharacterized protein n=1 Tax=Panaeolus cyanescens TaxID=181874 RepID=A0A409WF20_9AGAR|nr:hypothetical protein CVT24_009764 [Panaeolus cyanescens]